MGWTIANTRTTRLLVQGLGRGSLLRPGSAVATGSGWDKAPQAALKPGGREKGPLGM